MAITFVQFKTGFGVPNPSPFCMKAEILLKMAGVDYQTEILNDPRKAPKGKLPMLRDDGADIADSALIRRHLEMRYGVDFDPGLSDIEKAQSHAFARMIEERLYWVILYSRWFDDANWQVIRDFWFGDMPPVIRSLLPKIARRMTEKGMHGHGIGRHDAADIYAFGAQDFAALATQLGDKPFMFGEAPTSLDASAYPIIVNSLIEAMPGPVLDAARRHANFSGYVERCTALWFPES